MAATFEALAERSRTWRGNAYFEVVRRRLKDGETESEFLVISRGYLEKDGSKRWTKFVTIPDDAELRAWIAEAVREL